LLWRSLPERPDPLTVVDGPRSETGSGAQTRVHTRRILVSLSQQAHDALASGLAVLGKTLDAESRREPGPESPQKLSAPPSKATPAPPYRPRVDLESEAGADLALGQAVDEVKPEGFEDHRSGIPPTWVEQVGQDADRLLAARAEVPPDGDLVHEGDSKDLPPVDAMAHDSKPFRTEGQVPTPWATPGTKRLDRRKSGSKIDQLVDGTHERP
jgi:hypothetical protein